MSEEKSVTEQIHKKPYGRNVPPPVELCARNLPRPMYNLMVTLCYFCQRSSSERDCFIMDSGRAYFSVQMCSKCLEYNKASQEAGSAVLRRHLAEEEAIKNEKPRTRSNEII